MNLHEECLLKYLLNPLNLLNSTEQLKQNNRLIENKQINTKNLKINSMVQYHRI